MKRIFISHPYASNPQLNKKKVENICKYWQHQGFMVISPLHLFSFYESDVDREQILQVCRELIDMCSIIAVYGDSEGCQMEEKYARKKGKQVWKYYKKINFKKLMEEDIEILGG